MIHQSLLTWASATTELSAACTGPRPSGLLCIACMTCDGPFAAFGGSSTESIIPRVTSIPASRNSRTDVDQMETEPLLDFLYVNSNILVTCHSLSCFTAFLAWWLFSGRVFCYSHSPLLPFMFDDWGLSSPSHWEEVTVPLLRAVSKIRWRFFVVSKLEQLIKYFYILQSFSSQIFNFVLFHKVLRLQYYQK